MMAVGVEGGQWDRALEETIPTLNPRPEHSLEPYRFNISEAVLGYQM